MFITNQLSEFLQCEPSFENICVIKRCSEFLLFREFELLNITNCQVNWYCDVRNKSGFNSIDQAGFSRSCQGQWRWRITTLQDDVEIILNAIQEINKFAVSVEIRRCINTITGSSQVSGWKHPLLNYIGVKIWLLVIVYSKKC